MSADILRAIQDANMIFVSAQPDTIYFHWQVELYLYQFKQHGILDRCYAIFGYKGNGPSAYVTNLAKKYPNVLSYKDDRVEKTYVPSIRPHILAKFFKDRPELGNNVFYHDSDIFLVKLPRFDLMLNDTVGYLSDTISYIGYNYIRDCGILYKAKYPELPDDDIFHKMCSCMNIDPELIQSNEANSGGAQYLLKNIDSQFWLDVETSCNQLYRLFLDYEKLYSLENPIQKWTADMWAVLWNYWKRGGKTVIHKELDFSWAVSSSNDFFSKNIFHLAGVTEKLAHDKFFKSKYTGKNVFEEYLHNTSIFNHVSKDNASYEYIQVLKKYVHSEYSSFKTEQTKSIQRFRIVTKLPESDIYYKDSKQCCGKPMWRSSNSKYIIFHNSTSWVLTYSHYEKELGEGSGGIAFSTSYEPYEDNWCKDYSIELLEDVTA